MQQVVTDSKFLFVSSWGNLQFKDHEWQPNYKIWADQVANIFGGLDIISIDVLHGVDGQECVLLDNCLLYLVVADWGSLSFRSYILELNDTAGGLMYDHEQEDLSHIREVVLHRMSQLWTKTA